VRQIDVQAWARDAGSREDIWYHMLMARTQTLVQLDDGLVALLDQRAARSGASRSALIRQAIEAYLAGDADTAIDEAILAGYGRVPADEPAADVIALATASIEAEPW
jgi:metal-responsive CopG/Arc/MetJ family transcriptional regulator